jgi:hypothetical protein
MRVLFNLKADTPNINGTIYPKDVLIKAIDEYNKNHVKIDRALGEMGQPKEIHTTLTNIAFRINEIEYEDEHWIAEIEILPTPMGEELKDILSEDRFEDMRIVTMVVGEVTENEDGTRILNNMDITGVGIEPKENCA